MNASFDATPPGAGITKARRHFQIFRDDPGVDERVKRVLREEYSALDRQFEIWLEHSSGVAGLAREIACREGADELFVWEAAWLHDIGIRYTWAPGIECHGEEPYLRHGLIGAEICRRAGLPAHALVCERHVGTGLTAQEILEGKLPLPARDMLCETLEEKIVCYADQFFSKSSTKPLSVEEIRRRTGRHGPTQLARFEAMHELFGISEVGEVSIPLL